MSPSTAAHAAAPAEPVFDAQAPALDERAAPHAWTLPVSVVLPTCGRPELLTRCLEALVRQTLPAAAYEIVVVDDGRSPETKRLVARIADRHGATRIVCIEPAPHGKGPAAARNAGWRAARGRVIAFTDDDTVPSRDWLAQGLAGLPDWAGAAAGRVRVPVPRRPTDWERTSAGLDGAEFVTANCFVRRAALAVLGGFDERFAKPWREDSDLYFALIEKGYRVVPAPAAVVLHPVRAAPWGVSLKTQRNIFFDALLYKKHRALYREKISPRPPIGYYVVVALLAAAVALAAKGHLAAASGAAGAWLAWTLWFAARRLHGARRDLRHVAEMMLTSALIPPLAVFWRLAGALRFRVLFA